MQLRGEALRLTSSSLIQRLIQRLPGNYVQAWTGFLHEENNSLEVWSELRDIIVDVRLMQRKMYRGCCLICHSHLSIPPTLF